MNKLVVCFTFLSVIFLSSCTTGPSFKKINSVENKALVYFYREPNLTASISSCRISADGVDLGKIFNNGYFSAYLPPANTVILGEMGISSLQINVNLKAGETYYIHCGAYTSYIEIKLMPNHIGEQEISDNRNSKG